MDHVTDYKPPKESSKADKELTRLQLEGCAPVLTTPQVKKGFIHQNAHSLSKHFQISTNIYRKT